MPRKCAQPMSLGDENGRMLRDDDNETSKTIGQAGLTRKLEAPDHPCNLGGTKVCKNRYKGEAKRGLTGKNESQYPTCT